MKVFNKKTFFAFVAFLSFNVFLVPQAFSQTDFADFDIGEIFDEDFDLNSLLEALSEYFPDDQEVRDLTIFDDEQYDYDSDDYGSYSYDSDDYGDDEYHDVFIIDEAGLISQNEAFALNEKLMSVTNRYGIGVYILLINDYENYASSVERATEKLYDECGFGVGAERSGMLLLLSMADRSFDWYTYGYGEAAFNSHKSRIEGSFLDDFRANDWFSGLSDFVSTAESILKSDRDSGVNYEEALLRAAESAKSKMFGIGAVIAVIVAFIFAMIRLGIEKSKMKNVVQADNADKYVTDNGVAFSRNEDVYLYSNSYTRTIETSSSRSGGGGGGGGSHHSGHF